MVNATTTRETVAIVAADGTGIDLLHADVTVEDGYSTTEHVGQDWIDASEADGLGADDYTSFVRSARAFLADHGWRIVSDWRDTAHYGGLREVDVEPW